VTKGLLQKFGPDRVLDTPITEVRTLCISVSPWSGLVWLARMLASFLSWFLQLRLRWLDDCGYNGLVEGPSDSRSALMVDVWWNMLAGRVHGSGSGSSDVRAEAYRGVHDVQLRHAGKVKAVCAYVWTGVSSAAVEGRGEGRG
jgi:hypothetical protein